MKIKTLRRYFKPLAQIKKTDNRSFEDSRDQKNILKFFAKIILKNNLELSFKVEFLPTLLPNNSSTWVICDNEKKEHKTV